MNKVRVRVKKHRSKIVEKKRRAPVVIAIFYMAVISLLVSLMIAKCPSQIFVKATGPQAQKGEEKMQVTIFAGSASYRHHGLESLTLRHENGNEYPINAKDVEEKMHVLLGGKFRYVIEVKG